MVPHDPLVFFVLVVMLAATITAAATQGGK